MPMPWEKVGKGVVDELDDGDEDLLKKETKIDAVNRITKDKIIIFSFLIGILYRFLIE